MRSELHTSTLKVQTITENVERNTERVHDLQTQLKEEKQRVALLREENSEACSNVTKAQSSIHELIAEKKLLTAKMKTITNETENEHLTGKVIYIYIYILEKSKWKQL